LRNHKSGQEGIYPWIQRELKADPSVPYAFQNMMTAGFEDITGILFRNNLPHFLQEQLAFQLEKGIRSSMGKKAVSPSLEKHLAETSLYFYLDQALSRLRDGIRADSLDPVQLYAWGMQLATEDSRPEAVKLGMLILGQYENDVTRSVLRTLGLHSDYTLYAVEATALWSEGHTFLFDLARNTVGYGKLYCIRQLRPASYRERLWLLRESIDLSADREMAAVYCLLKPDMTPFLLRKEIDAVLLEDFSVLISYGIGSSMLPSSKTLYPLISRYLTAEEAFLSRFIDVAAIAAVSRFSSERIAVYKASGTADQETVQQLQSFHSRSVEQIRLYREEAEQLLYNELSDPYEDIGVILGTIRFLHTEASVELPPFPAFQTLIEAYGFTSDLMAFFLQSYPEKYLPDLIQIWYDIIPEEVWNEPETVPEYIPDSEYPGDLYTAELLHAMRATGNFEEDLLLDCLHARHQKVRFAAAECIEQLPDPSGSVLSAVTAAMESEKDPSVLRLLRHLAGTDSQDYPALPFLPGQVAVSEEDPVLFRTVLTHPEGIELPDEAPLPVTAGEVLCIVQHPVQQMILIARQDGTVLGGIPEADQRYLYFLQGSGRSFYAKLDSSEDPEENQSLLICESGARPPEKKTDNVLPFRKH
jgi:hypothetical protein